MQGDFETIRGAHFGREEVEADGREFIDCSFNGTTLIFRGIEAFHVRNGMGKPPVVSFRDHAETTMIQLAGMYRFGLAGVVEDLFEKVRNPFQDTMQ